MYLSVRLSVLITALDYYWLIKLHFSLVLTDRVERSSKKGRGGWGASHPLSEDGCGQLSKFALSLVGGSSVPFSHSSSTPTLPTLPVHLNSR